MRTLCVLALAGLVGSAACERNPSPRDTATLVPSVRASYALAEDWLLGNMRDKGLFRYIYDPRTGRYPDRNNELRQLLASRLLAELASENPSLVRLHDRNLAFLLQFWYRSKGKLGFIVYNGRSKLGGNAMALRTLVSSPRYPHQRARARAIAWGIVSLLNEDGSFRPWFKEPRYEYDAERLLYFYSGEAILALTEYYERSRERRFLTAALKAQDHYLEEYVQEIDKNYYPAYVPWHTQSLNVLHRITGDRRYPPAAFVLNDRLLEILDRDGHKGRFFSPEHPEFGTPHSSSDGVYTEGLAHAYEIALRVGDKAAADRYLEAIELAARNLISLQYTAKSAASHEHSDRLVGALRYSAGDPRIRIDTTQHTMDAFRKIMEVLA